MTFIDKAKTMLENGAPSTSSDVWQELGSWIGQFGSPTDSYHVFPECVARVPVSLWGSGG